VVERIGEQATTEGLRPEGVEGREPVLVVVILVVVVSVERMGGNRKKRRGGERKRVSKRMREREREIHGRRTSSY
jgi:hypothetical protein